MRRLRTLSSRRLTAIVAAALVLAATAAIAQAGLIGSDPKPEPKALDRAVRDAANAPAVDGISARISFTNGLLPVRLAAGRRREPARRRRRRPPVDGTGRRFRLELQSDAGDAQIASDGRTLSVYDASAKTVYRLALPDERPPQGASASPSRSRRSAAASTASPARGRCRARSRRRPRAGRRYTVRIAPKDDGGLLGAGELAWDAVQGRAAARRRLRPGRRPSRCSSSPPPTSRSARVPDGDLRIAVPRRHEDRRRRSARRPPAAPSAAQAGASGVEAVQRELGFPLAAPRELAGLPRKEVRLVRLGDANGALSVYGEGLGGIVVIQHRPGRRGAAGGRRRAGLPQVNIDGATGTELATALGTMVTLRARRRQLHRARVGPPAAVENAARGLR